LFRQAKQDARDAIVAKEQHAEEMADLSEAVEMATLDKEMAEEKVKILIYTHYMWHVGKN